jgi:hypothetical protein
MDRAMVTVKVWPFPPFPNPKDKNDKREPKFNPDNYEDAPR